MKPATIKPIPASIGAEQRVNSIRLGLPQRPAPWNAFLRERFFNKRTS